MNNNIWLKVKKTPSCWNWIGEITDKGYGRLQNGYKRVKAHRYFYELFVGKIPVGLEIDHLCRNKKCVNPKHLELVTHRENIIRAWAERKKNTPNCPNGHPYSGKNLYIYFDKKKNLRWRACKECKILATIRWLKRRKRK